MIRGIDLPSQDLHDLNFEGALSVAGSAVNGLDSSQLYLFESGR